MSEPPQDAAALAAQWILKAAALEEGEHVLEVACGNGELGFEAASIVGSSGVVICSDPSEEMIKGVRETIRGLGLKNVDGWVLDANNLQLRTGERFDAVLCRFGYMSLRDPGAALSEGHRALKADGRLAFAVWGTAKENPWLSIVLDAVIAHFGTKPPKPGTPGPFALGDRKLLKGLLTEAGFIDVSVKAVKARQPYASLEEWWERIPDASPPLAAVLQKLPEKHATAVRERAFEAASKHVGEGAEVLFPAVVLGARAIRPEDEPLEPAEAEPED